MSDRYYRIQNQGTGLVLAVHGGNPTAASQVIVTQENDRPNQHWKINQAGLIQSRLNGYALELGVLSWEYWLGCVYLAPVKRNLGQNSQQWQLTQQQILKNKGNSGLFGLAITWKNTWELIAYPINEANSQITEKWQFFPVEKSTQIIPGNKSQKQPGLLS